jgi:outer membrane murein-binding lipoprotein Lpp
MNIALYELAADFRETADRLSDMDLDEQTLRDTLESIAYPVEQKAVQVAAFVRNLEAAAEQIKQAEKQMADRRKAMENRAANVRQYLMDNMRACGFTKIEHPMFKVAIRQNPESVVIEDERQIPADYLRQPETPPPVPDKTLLKKAMQDGYEIPGAKLTRTLRLEIK